MKETNCSITSKSSNFCFILYLFLAVGPPCVPEGASLTQSFPCGWCSHDLLLLLIPRSPINKLLLQPPHTSHSYLYSVLIFIKMQLPVIRPLSNWGNGQSVIWNRSSSTCACTQGYHIILMSLSKQVRNDQTNQKENI